MASKLWIFLQDVRLFSVALTSFLNLPPPSALTQAPLPSFTLSKQNRNVCEPHTSPGTKPH